jgi:hypothetical protein
MLRRNLGLGFFACVAFVVATACGGTVKQGTDSPSEQLRTGGPDRCKAACTTVVACGLESRSCDCACACPDGGADCTCPPCMCTMMTSSSCESECTKSVQKVVDEEPACDASMLALLDCLGGASCKNGEEPCQAEAQAFKACTTEHRAKVVVTPPTDISRPSGGSGIVNCQISSGFGSAAADGAPPPPPGELSCGSGYDQCSDGRSYKIECRTTAGAGLECTCLVDGVSGATFSAPDCDQMLTQEIAYCGWNIG